MSRPLALLLLSGLLFVGPPASAQGPACTFMVGNMDVGSGGTVESAADAPLPYQVTANQSIVHWTLTVRYSVLRIPVLDERFEPGEAHTRDGNASLAAITRYGTGVYNVDAEATLADGSHCATSFRLRIPGFAVKSVLGLGAVALLGLGGAGLVAMGAKAVMDANDMRTYVQDFLRAAREAKKEADEAVAHASPTPGEADRDPSAPAARDDEHRV